MDGQLVANVVLMYAILVGINLPAPLLGLEFEESRDQPRLAYAPPGYVIPIAWFVLFTLLGIARSMVVGTPAPGAGWAIVGLATLCAAYAYYTLGLAKLTGVSALWYGLVGNVVVVLAALAVAYGLYPVSATAALLVFPVAVWTSFATAIVLGEIKMEGLV
jgi:tryptophan-rich sensory protein